MNKSILFSVLTFLTMISLLACQSKYQTDANNNTDPVVMTPSSEITCKEPRSPMCTREYKPVCATRDTGVRCATTPCPSTELVTKSNACTACADEKVISYVDGACS